MFQSCRKVHLATLVPEESPPTDATTLLPLELGAMQAFFEQWEKTEVRGAMYSKYGAGPILRNFSGCTISKVHV